MTLGEAQSEQCSKLIHHLQSLQIPVLGNNSDETMDDQVLEDDEEDLLEYGLTHEQTDSGGVELPPIMTSALSDYSETDRLLLNLLSSLFTQLPTAEDNKFYTPILRFLILESLSSQGHWLPPRRITEAISTLTFCGRQTLFYEVVKATSGQTESRYSQ
jgi:hypothetical protein